MGKEAGSREKAAVWMLKLRGPGTCWLFPAGPLARLRIFHPYTIWNEDATHLLAKHLLLRPKKLPGSTQVVVAWTSTT